MAGDWWKWGVLLQELISFYWFIILRQNVQLASVVLQPWVYICLMCCNPVFRVLHGHFLDQVDGAIGNLLPVFFFEDESALFVFYEDISVLATWEWNAATESLNVKWVW